MRDKGKKARATKSLASVGTWTCHQYDWEKYLQLAIAFGWRPAGAFFKCDEGGFREHPSGSYLGNDFQIVTDKDAAAMAAALTRAIATITSGSPITADQATALKALRVCDDEAAATGCYGLGSFLPPAAYVLITARKQRIR